MEGPCSCLRSVSGVDDAEPEDGIEAKLDWVCDDGRRPLSDPIPTIISINFVTHLLLLKFTQFEKI